MKNQFSRRQFLKQSALFAVPPPACRSCLPAPAKGAHPPPRQRPACLRCRGRLPRRPVLASPPVVSTGVGIALQQLPGARLVPRREVGHLGALGAAMPARNGRLDAQRMYQLTVPSTNSMSRNTAIPPSLASRMWSANGRPSAGIPSTLFPSTSAPGRNTSRPWPITTITSTCSIPGISRGTASPLGRRRTLLAAGPRRRAPACGWR